MFITLKIPEVEVKDDLLKFEMRVVRGLYYPTPTKGYHRSGLLAQDQGFHLWADYFRKAWMLTPFS